ncbi:hypothetical protein ACHAW6_002820 [Cyclotella cf. meneghiniana]
MNVSIRLDERRNATPPHTFPITFILSTTNAEAMMLHTPEVKQTHLSLSSCPPPPQVRRSKLRPFHSTDSNGDNDCEQVRPIFRALSLHYRGKNNEPPRSSGWDSTTHEMVLKPRPMYGNSSFSRMSPPSPLPSPSPFCTREDGDDVSAVPKVSLEDLSNESTVRSTLSRCLHTSRSLHSRAA